LAQRRGWQAAIQREIGGPSPCHDLEEVQVSCLDVAARAVEKEDEMGRMIDLDLEMEWIEARDRWDFAWIWAHSRKETGFCYEELRASAPLEEKKIALAWIEERNGLAKYSADRHAKTRWEMDKNDSSGKRIGFSWSNYEERWEEYQEKKRNDERKLCTINMGRETATEEEHEALLAEYGVEL
jgi:hypothetical protein